MPLTPNDVHDVRFDHAPLGKRGYHEDQVDDFLDRVELALRGEAPLTSEEVKAVEFDQGSLVRRGYDEKQVDDFLESVVNHLEGGGPSTNGHANGHRVRLPKDSTAAGQAAAPEEPAETTARLAEPVTEPVPRPRAEVKAAPAWPEPDPNSVPLPPAVPGMHGYRPRDVQRMAECVRASLRSAHGPTAEDIARMRLERVADDEKGLDPFLVEALRDAWVAELRRQGR